MASDSRRNLSPGLLSYLDFTDLPHIPLLHMVVFPWFVPRGRKSYAWCSGRSLRRVLCTTSSIDLNVSSWFPRLLAPVPVFAPVLWGNAGLQLSVPRLEACPWLSKDLLAVTGDRQVGDPMGTV